MRRRGQVARGLGGAASVLVVWCFVLGCAQTTSRPAAATQVPGPPSERDATAIDDQCAINPALSADPPFDEDSARLALAPAVDAISSCGGDTSRVEVTWGPTGCLRAVHLVGPNATDGQATCLLQAFRLVRVPSFGGAGVKVVLDSRGNPQSFESISGYLEPAVIQNVVRGRYGEFKFCYEGGLAHNRALRGRVSARFRISADGHVSGIGNAGSDIPEADVVRCTLSRFEGLRFPPPKGGVVWVVYPVMFEPPK